jgi:riboflavin transporter FmnP
MRLATIVVGEIILLVASVLVFRSLWTLLDQYFGQTNLWPMLIIGLILTVVALIIVNYEVKCELNQKKNYVPQQ